MSKTYYDTQFTYFLNNCSDFLSFLNLQVLNLTLDEGSSLPLTSRIIKVASHHFSGLNFLYQVIVPPGFGHLEHSRIPGMPINAFTHTEV